MARQESSTNGGLQLGMSIPETLPSLEAVEFAVSLEAAGFEMASLTEIFRDPFTRAATILDRTTRLTVGTGVAVWSRSPVTAASTAAELHELSDGRFLFGIGVGTKYMSEAFHGVPWDRPARRMAEYVRIIRGAWEAHDEMPLTFEGEYYSVRGYLQPCYRSAPKLFLAAVQEGMLRLAARQADGVIFNPASTRRYCEDQALPVLEAAAEAAGRHADDIERHVVLRCAVNDDGDVARHWARLGICEYGQYPVHQRVYGMNGFGDEAAAIAAAMVEGDLEAAAAAVSDEMVEEFSVSGTPQEARSKLRTWEGLVHGVCLASPGLGLSPDELGANCAAIRDAFATVPS
jgi:alkanesulfonate monooxygenase SsuD/methylene tetrahydromethanopterin reductase-like flavin-dependent oxidoreductase (luciferase family)